MEHNIHGRKRKCTNQEIRANTSQWSLEKETEKVPDSKTKQGFYMRPVHWKHLLNLFTLLLIMDEIEQDSAEAIYFSLFEIGEDDGMTKHWRKPLSLIPSCFLSLALVSSQCTLACVIEIISWISRTIMMRVSMCSSCSLVIGWVEYQIGLLGATTGSGVR